MPKTALSLEAVRSFLNQALSGRVSLVEPLVEGEESQAFTFVHLDRAYVIRLNPSAEGYYKDDYVQRRFGSSAIPIPAIVRIGQIDAEHAFCISEKAPGITLQAAEPSILGQMVEPAFQVWEAISQVEVSQSAGYGDFDQFGTGQFSSWRAYLSAALDPQHYDWTIAPTWLDAALISRVADAFYACLPRCPERRRLVHGDFGSNNVLAHDGRISAVLDWDCAKYGDPLFDIATAYYWRTWLACMDEFATYSERHLSSQPDYRARLACYQLRIGLAEIYEQAAAGKRQPAEWHQRRCAEVIRGL